MSKRIEKIKKLFRETLLDGTLVDENHTPREIIDLCEEQGKLFSNRGQFIASVRSTWKEQECIRIIFVLKESDGGKVKNIDKIFDLIKDLEQALVNIDRCDQSRSDGFIYLDVIKKMVPVD